MFKHNKPVASEWEDYNKFDKTWAVEPKLDGERYLLGKINGNLKLTRDGIQKLDQFPELVSIDIPEGTWLDGELCVLTNDNVADFNKILTRSTTHKLMIKLLSIKQPVTFVAFDVLQHASDDLVQILPYSERRKILESLQEQPGFKVIKSYDPSQLSLKYIKDNNMEGVVLKARDGSYFDKWYKFKNFIEADFKVKSINSKSRLISSLELIDNNGNDVGSVNYVNYPQTDEWKQKLPGMTAVVRYMRSKTDNLRFPVLKELRDVIQ